LKLWAAVAAEPGAALGPTAPYIHAVIVRRREFIRGVVLSGAALACSPARVRKPIESDRVVTQETKSKQSGRMPTLFVGHGSPMNAILDNVWTQGFASLGKRVPEPRAILAVSAHWYVNGTYLTSDAKPRTIHDFGGFPQALYEIEYPAPGKPELVTRVRQLVGEQSAAGSGEWGLDHGTWSVLRFMYPDARIPVVQLSIDQRLTVPQHLELAKSLAELRDEGVLIFASGNLVHNLRDAFTRMQTGRSDTPDWAQRFDSTLTSVLAQHDTQKLVTLYPDSADGRMSHPSPDHYLPVLYAYGAAGNSDEVSFPVTGFDAGSLSMRCVLFG
jgi:4,5-DOPA dioxygenase extradiol